MNKLKNSKRDPFKKQLCKALKDIENLKLSLDNIKVELQSSILLIEKLAFIYVVKGINFSDEDCKKSLQLIKEKNSFKLPKEGWNSCSYI